VFTAVHVLADAFRFLDSPLPGPIGVSLPIHLALQGTMDPLPSQQSGPFGFLLVGVSAGTLSHNTQRGLVHFYRIPADFSLRIYRQAEPTTMFQPSV